MSQSSVVTTHRTPRPDHSARLLVAAFAIADACVRSEVECWCEGHIGDDDAAWWDTSKPSGITDGTPDAAIARIANLPVQHVTSTAAQLRGVIMTLEANDLSAFDTLHMLRAQEAKNTALASLKVLLDQREAADKERAENERGAAELAEAQRVEAERRAAEEAAAMAERERLDAEAAEQRRIADEQAAAERQRQAQEQQRVNAIRQRIDGMRDMRRQTVGKSSAEIAGMVDRFSCIAPGDFAEFYAEASEVHQEVLRGMREDGAAAEVREANEARMAEQQAELDRAQAAQRQREAEEQAERERRAREEHEREERARIENENLRVANATLIEATTAGIDLLRELGQERHLVTRMMQAAVEREGVVAKAAKRQRKAPAVEVVS